MKYTVIGNDGCTRCDTICDMFMKRDIDFMYYYLSDYNDNVAEKLISSAMDKGFTTFPLIYNESINEFVKLEDVV